jgi:hypothetical protein
MADNGRLTVDQKVKAVLFYAKTKSVVATERRFLAHLGYKFRHFINFVQTCDFYRISHELQHSLAHLQHRYYDVTILMG